MATKKFEFDQNLAPYNLEQYYHWMNLAGHITQSTVSRLQTNQDKLLTVPEAPSQDKIDLIFSLSNKSDMNANEGNEGNEGRKAYDAEIQTSPEKQFMEKFREGIPPEDPSEEQSSSSQDEKPDLSDFREPDSEIPFMKIISKTKLKNADPGRITLVNFDKSHVFQSLVDQYNGVEELISEFQASFIMFVLGQSFEGFEQWKKFVELFSRCEQAISSDLSSFFLETYPQVLLQQIAEVPDDYFEDITTGNNFLTASLKVRLRFFGVLKYNRNTSNLCKIQAPAKQLRT